MFVPEMGNKETKTIQTGISAALFTPVQERLLGLLFAQPERSFQSSELIDLVGAGTGATHRLLKRFEEAGLIRATFVGRSKFYQANPDSPVFDELVSLMTKTSGLVGAIRQALDELDLPPDLALIHGSVARAEDDSSSDVDLILVGDALDYRSVYEALSKASDTIDRQINPSIFSSDEWTEDVRNPDSFLGRIMDGSVIWVVGSEHD